MSSRREEVVRRFRTKDDDGDAHQLTEYQEYIIDQGDRVPGYRRIADELGRPVNALGDGRYEITGLNIIVTE